MKKEIAPVKKTRKRRCDSKYDPKFTKQLKSGIRAEGLSKEELCSMWRICMDTFDDWLKSIPEFAAAYKLSKADFAAYWMRLNRDVAAGKVKGNAGCITFALTNIEEIRWAARVEVKNTDERIGSINIITIEAPQTIDTPRVIEYDADDSNVVQLLEHKEALNVKS